MFCYEIQYVVDNLSVDCAVASLKLCAQREPVEIEPTCPVVLALYRVRLRIY